MKTIRNSIILAVVIIAIVAGVYFTISNRNGYTTETLSTQIGDFREILKLSVLDVDLEDAYIEKVEGNTLIYKIPAHCEFKYDLEKVEMSQTESAITITLPLCEAEVTSKGAPTLYYEEEKLLSFLLDNNVKDEQDKKVLDDLKEKIRERLTAEYQDLAFEQAKSLLTSFYSNTGKEIIIKQATLQ
ncbi:MAG: DUF4230 domain-containing protein [Prevotella sp.]|nr:DUF4230 domain-containing protein [Prevotella sp.]